MEHQIDPRRIHHTWDAELEPALRIASGDSVRFELLMTAHGQLHEGDRFEQARFDFDALYNLVGPVHVEGARPGDTLRVDVLALEPGGWGWCVIMPGQGLLPDRFTDGCLRTFDLRGGDELQFAPGVRIPFAPFLGTMGNHPGEPAQASVLPPHRGGGNLDNRHLIAGSTIWLPVWCDGALFSCGDPHALQGDGEVCVTGLECDMRATLRFTLEHRAISAPRFRTPGALTPRVDAAGHLGVMAIAPDLMQGAREAVSAAIDLLVAERRMSAQDAYMLCSLAGDLKLLEVVDAGMWNVGLTLPLSLFDG